MITIGTTEEAYEGYCQKEDVWEWGSVQSLSKDGRTDIRWSNEAYEEIMREVRFFVKGLIGKYEKRYRTKVERLAVVGRLGLWNGNPIGGQIISTDRDLFGIARADEIEIYINNDRELEIQYRHHDGTHVMNLYFLTKNTIKKHGISIDSSSPDDMENIYYKVAPIRVDKKTMKEYGFSFEEEKK